MRDKKLAFLVAGLGLQGEHRARMKSRFIRWIESFEQEGSLGISLYRNKSTFKLLFRPGNVADYWIAGEFVRGSYKPPSFTPKSIIDAGANIGTFSIHAKAFYPEATLVCFEPDEDNYRQLVLNLAENGIDGNCRMKGAWSKSGKFYFHRSNSHTGYVDDSPTGIPIDCELPEIGPDCWLKMDIEGSEYEVLPSLLENGRFPRFISMEIHHYTERGSSLIRLLQEYKYQIEGDLDTKEKCVQISAERQIHKKPKSQ